MIERLAPFFEHVALAPPGWPVAALPAAGRLGHGWGRGPAGATRRALGEMVELASLCAWGDEHPRPRPPAEGAVWDVPALLGFAPWQLAARAGWNEVLGGLDHLPDWGGDRAGGHLPDGGPDRLPDRWRGAGGWIAAERLLPGAAPPEGARVWVPAGLALLGHGRLPADSNGGAAGPTPAAARLAAVLELVERDATARWWYGGAPARREAPAPGSWAAELAGWLARRGRVLHLLDITSDLGVPVRAALIADRDGRRVSAGFAAAMAPAGARRRALGEALQMELRVAAGTADPRWLAEADLSCHPAPAAPPADPAHPADPGAAGRAAPAALAALAAILARAGCRVALVDRSRAEFGVPVVRALSPDLCHWKPRLGRARLGRASRLRALFAPGGGRCRPLLRG